MSIEIVIGKHSIANAIENSSRKIIELVATKESIKEIRNYTSIDKVKVVSLTPKALQEEAQRVYNELNFKFSRVPSNIFLKCEPTKIFDINEIYEDLSTKSVKIICLDQVTDVHNAAAILRTAAFYGVDYLLVSQKGNFGITPTFTRIASGALEHVKIVNCASLPKAISKLQEKGVQCFGFSEDGSSEGIKGNISENVCLVMGAEDVGLSNALKRVINNTVRFEPKGKISSLNVSIASAIAMEKFFSA